MQNVPKTMNKIAGQTFSDLKVLSIVFLLAVVTASEILFASFAARSETGEGNKDDPRDNAKQNY